MSNALQDRLAEELVASLTPGSHFSAALMPSHMDVSRADLKTACLAMLTKHAEALTPLPLEKVPENIDESKESSHTVEAP